MAVATEVQVTVECKYALLIAAFRDIGEMLKRVEWEARYADGLLAVVEAVLKEERDADQEEQ